MGFGGVARGAGAASAKQNTGPRLDIIATDAARAMDVLRTMFADYTQKLLLEQNRYIGPGGV